MRGFVSLGLKTAAALSVGLVMVASTSGVSYANDAQAHLERYLLCLHKLATNAPDRVEVCGIGDATFNTSSIYTGTGFSPYVRKRCNHDEKPS
ncbi:MAG: hypothetical protein ABIO40_07515 [Devosia sp.]